MVIPAHRGTSGLLYGFCTPVLGITLNCAVDAGAKQTLVSAIEGNETVQKTFLLEPLTGFAGRGKLTLEMKPAVIGTDISL